MIQSRDPNVYHSIHNFPNPHEIVIGRCKLEDGHIEEVPVFIQNNKWQPRIVKTYIIAWRYLFPHEDKELGRVIDEASSEEDEDVRERWLSEDESNQLYILKNFIVLDK